MSKHAALWRESWKQAGNYPSVGNILSAFVHFGLAALDGLEERLGKLEAARTCKPAPEVANSPPGMPLLIEQIDRALAPAHAYTAQPNAAHMKRCLEELRHQLKCMPLPPAVFVVDELAAKRAQALRSAILGAMDRVREGRAVWDYLYAAIRSDDATMGGCGTATKSGG